MSRFVLQLCCDVPADDQDGIGMIGASPLEDLIKAWPDLALSLVESEVKTNPVCFRH
jgi:hypothetical protein